MYINVYIILGRKILEKRPLGQPRRWDKNIKSKMFIFWKVTQCSLVDTDRRFRVAYCLHEILKMDDAQN
jgi:hypothetical protein